MRDEYLSEEGESDAGTEEFAQVFLGELLERLENEILNLCGVFGGVGRVVWDHGRGEICAIDRVVDGDGDLKGFTAGKDRAGDTSPHRLERISR